MKTINFKDKKNKVLGIVTPNELIEDIAEAQKDIELIVCLYVTKDDKIYVSWSHAKVLPLLGLLELAKAIVLETGNGA